MTGDIRKGLLLVGVLFGVGMLKVAQETSLALTAYRVGRSYATWRDLDNETVWLRTQVLSLGSPIALAKTMREQHVRLVAWSKSEPPVEPPAAAAPALALQPPTEAPASGSAQLAKAEADE